jgi:hypothetical protein
MANTFDPRQHLRTIKSSQGNQEYLDVKWRIAWFREQCPQGTIDTEEIVVDLDREVEAEAFVWNAEKRRSEKIIKHGRGYARYRAVVTDGKGGRATGTKSENAANFPDFCEKSETGSIGRALAALGYGTQFTGDEFFEDTRIVDAPVESDQLTTSNTTRQAQPKQPQQPQQAPDGTAPSSITEQQLASIRKLSEHLNKALPDKVDAYSFVDGRTLIQQLTAEYREAKQRRAS